MIDYDLRLLMPDTVALELPVDARNVYGVITYGAAVDHQCRIEQTTSMVRDQDGRERVSGTQIFLASQIRIPPTTRVTLPDGSHPAIMSIESVQDENGAYFTKLNT